MVLCITLGIILFLVIRLYLIKRSANEIREQLARKLSADTNTLISISSTDRDMRRLAADLNIQLQRLRAEHIRYSRGDTELKNAVTNISHDLRTPLTAIISYLDLLEESPDKASQYIPILRERTEALAQLTEELFRYSVITSPECSHTLETVLLGSVLEESILGHYAALQERGITPVIEITEEKIVRRANRDALARVFSNLLHNAMKYSDGDLRVTMDDRGTITFSNRASGLDEVQAGRLFDRFYTIESPRRSTGLGLSIARALVEQMGGTITAEFTKGVLHIRLLFPRDETSVSV